MKIGKLILYTISFPYGEKSEAFLENEIEILSKNCDKLIIIPLKKESNYLRKIPKNVEVNNIIINREVYSGKKILLRYLITFLKIYFLSLFESKKNFNFYIKNLRKYSSILIGELELFHHLKNEFGNKYNSKKNIIYNYWFDQFLLSNCLLKKKYNLKLITRAHGFDLYDERNNNKPANFRKFKTNNCDLIFCVSNHGNNYLKSKTNKKNCQKIFTSYLGVNSNFNLQLDSYFNLNKKNKYPLIISIGSLIPLKRTDLIAKALLLYEEKIKWVHFGDGLERKKIESICNTFNPNINYELKGHVSNKILTDYLKENKVDLLVSTSEFEGLPVSMMEAISFGIPMLACDVYGVKEIVVPEKTGILMNKNINPLELKNYIELALKRNFKANSILNFFEKNFNNKTNYERFINKILKELF
ncbi:MAG: hypothetical protein CL853_05850 [Crocinitomicaceae bacterium]|nr:hypothetical protein [Crocinitomicaceae bacterium]